VDVSELVSVEAVQEELGLGPNGALVYCMEYLQQNLDWLTDRLAPLVKEGRYLVFDCPGQAELFSLHGALRAILSTLGSTFHHRLVALHLVDAALCSDPPNYLSALLLSLSTMLHLELPQVNVLSKFDLVERNGELPLPPDFFMQAQGLSRLADAMEGRFPPRQRAMTRALCEVVEDFGLVAFAPLAVEEAESMARVVALADKANGFVFAGLRQQGEGTPGPPPELQYGAGLCMEGGYDLWDRMQEKYTRDPEGGGSAAEADPQERSDGSEKCDSLEDVR
jgi:GPN-loop GTPase